MESSGRKQYGTKMEKDRAKKAYVEKRLKRIKKSDKKYKETNPKMSKVKGALDFIGGTSTDKGKKKKLSAQFESIYAGKPTKIAGKEYSGRDRIDTVTATRKAKGGMIIAPKSGSAHYKSKQNAKSIAKKYFKGGIN
jgi:hypothetical protein